MAIPYTIAFEGGAAEDFSGTTYTHVLKVQGVVPDEEPVNEDDDELWGFVLPSNDGLMMRWVFIVNPLRSKVAEDSVRDHGDHRALMHVLKQKHVRIIPTGTDLPRINTTSSVDHNFWTGTNGILEPDGVRVRVTSWPTLSPNAETGSDSTPFTVKAVYPHAAN